MPYTPVEDALRASWQFLGGLVVEPELNAERERILTQLIPAALKEAAGVEAIREGDRLPIIEELVGSLLTWDYAIGPIDVLPLRTRAAFIRARNLLPPSTWRRLCEEAVREGDFLAETARARKLTATPHPMTVEAEVDQLARASDRRATNVETKLNAAARYREAADDLSRIQGLLTVYRLGNSFKDKMTCERYLEVRRIAGGVAEFLREEADWIDGRALTGENPERCACGSPADQHGYCAECADALDGAS